MSDNNLDEAYESLNELRSQRWNNPAKPGDVLDIIADLLNSAEYLYLHIYESRKKPTGFKSLNET